MVGWVHVVVIWLLAVPWSVKAQVNLNNRTFQWKFGGNFVASTFSECQTLPIIVEPLNSTTTDVGAAPYYLIAFEAGGIPSLSMIGSDPNNLTWENAHKRDSTLMLIVLDSNGNTGGVTPGLYNVTEGTETNCLPTLSDDMLPPTIASITQNITDRIETCEPWGLTVSGGTKPYQIVLSALESPIITNVTMGANDDVFTYIDRADPGEQLMASVVDATGRWGVSTGLITPYGSKNTDCVGLVSSSKTTAQIQQEARDRAAELARERRDHQHLVIGTEESVWSGDVG
ncbi:hypothetical protein BC629DRAFT_1180952 [Irpex lacteus]|nr:hypothetical protein BC629DRAFT_1180952 [Irpex lacteus]